MNIFIAGATGAIGKRLVPMLAAAGHHVVGMTRTPAKYGMLRLCGAEAVVADAFDRSAVTRAVVDAHPEVVVHQMTALSKMGNLKHFDREFEVTNRLRTEGTEILLAAAQEAGASCFIAQSYTGWPNERTGGRVKIEEDPLDPDPPENMRRSMEAIQRLESMVTSADGLTGIVLRYGSFYGPGTSIGKSGEVAEMVRKRRFPIFGSGAGVWSFLHIDDAARATALAIENAPVGIYNIVDDDPSEVAVWLPELALAVGAKSPRYMPAWLGKLLIGEAGMSMMNQARGSSNTKAKRTFGWCPSYKSWRDGFHRGL
jgi:nucleoside-diphosphate-sugar epimerase